MISRPVFLRLDYRRRNRKRQGDLKKSIDLQVFIKYNEEKALPGSLPLTDILRSRKVFWEDFTLNKARRYRLRASCNVLFSAMQKSEVGRLKSAERIKDYETL
jgi:hypothetical protein